MIYSSKCKVIWLGDPARPARLPRFTTSVMTANPASETDLPTLFDPVSLVKKGLCPVTNIRYGRDLLESHSLYYEQHGTGVEKIVFIMGCARLLFHDSGLP